MRERLAKLFRAMAATLWAEPAKPAHLYPAPEQLENVRELTTEERDQVAAFLRSTAGQITLNRARAIEFRAYRQNQPASWGACVDWLVSLSRVPRDRGDENQTDTDAGHGDLPISERVSP